ncbi:DUF29 domain-containing protein [Methylobacterium sp. Gmos1]
MDDPTLDHRRDGTDAVEGRASYERDYFSWVQEQVALIRARRFDEIDAEHVAEELEDLGKSQLSRLHSALRVLVMHMLKWDQQPEHRTASWIFSIAEQRRRYHRLLRDNPGLKPHRETALADAYEGARLWAAEETHLEPDDFPKECPYTWDDLLDRPFDFDSLKK